MPVVKPSQRLKLNKRSPGIPTRVAEPTGRAGAKNSNGPKGGSSKSSVPANRNSNTNKTGKVTKRTGKNNPNQIVRTSKSSRLNYAKLRGK